MRDVTIAIVGLFIGTVVALFLGHIIFTTYLKPDIELFRQNLQKEHKKYFKNTVEK